MTNVLLNHDRTSLIVNINYSYTHTTNIFFVNTIKSIQINHNTRKIILNLFGCDSFIIDCNIIDGCIDENEEPMIIKKQFEKALDCLSQMLGCNDEFFY